MNANNLWTFRRGGRDYSPDRNAIPFLRESVVSDETLAKELYSRFVEVFRAPRQIGGRIIPTSNCFGSLEKAPPRSNELLLAKDLIEAESTLFCVMEFPVIVWESVPSAGLFNDVVTFSSRLALPDLYVVPYTLAWCFALDNNGDLWLVRS